MKLLRPFVSLAAGFLPLLVFAIVDSFFGELAGVVAAVAFGTVEFSILFIKTGRPDPFVLADTGFLVILGTLSLLLNSGVFVLLKPAIVEFIFVAAVALLLAVKPEYLRAYMRKHLRNANVPDSAFVAMRRLVVPLLGILVMHATATAASALLATRAVWLFVSGPALYIGLGIWLAAFVVWNRLRSHNAPRSKIAHGEMLPLVDDQGIVVGSASRSACHSGPGKLHPVVHLHFFDTADRVFLQKRAATKDVQPGRWDSAVGGHVSYGESIESALARELFEELGVTPGDLVAAKATVSLIGRYIWETAEEREYVYLFISQFSGPFRPNPTEIDEARFWTRGEIQSALDRGGILTPNFIREWKTLLRGGRL